MRCVGLACDAAMVVGVREEQKEGEASSRFAPRDCRCCFSASLLHPAVNTQRKHTDTEHCYWTCYCRCHRCLLLLLPLDGRSPSPLPHTRLPHTRRQQHAASFDVERQRFGQ